MSEAPPSARSPTPRRTLPAEVSISNSRQIDFLSEVNGRDYRIQVALPRVPPPDAGYAALYVLDGFGYFGSATEVARGNAPATVVVGVSYPFSAAWAERVLDRHFHGEDRPAGTLQAIGAAAGLARVFDLTLPADDAALAAQSSAALPTPLAADVGGLDDFLKVIETEVKPRVQALTRIDAANQALFGYSLGGLAALHALFTAPDAFHSFIVGSPSIWWNGRAVLAGEDAFAARVATGQAAPRVLITMGALESDPPGPATQSAVPLEELTDMIARCRMVENGNELAARLQALPGRPPFEVADYLVFPGQGHGISAWSTLAAGIPFAFPKG